MCRFCLDPKLFYTPIEAALRWCGLLEYENAILEANWVCAQQLLTLFPQWPCLAKYVGLILDAIHHQELPSRSSALFTGTGCEWSPSSHLIRPSDLRTWMSIFHPDQRPLFLFGVSPDTGGSIRWGSYLTLKADRDALSIEFRRLGQLHAELEQKFAELGLEVTQLRDTAPRSQVEDAGSESSLLVVIGALLRLLLDPHSSTKKRPFFTSQEAIGMAIQDQFPSYPGLGKRTLDQRFAEANKRFTHRL